MNFKIFSGLATKEGRSTGKKVVVFLLGALLAFIILVVGVFGALLSAVGNIFNLTIIEIFEGERNKAQVMWNIENELDINIVLPAFFLHKGDFPSNEEDMKINKLEVTNFLAHFIKDTDNNAIKEWGNEAEIFEMLRSDPFNFSEGELEFIKNFDSYRYTENGYEDVPITNGWALPVKHSSPYISCLYGDDYIDGYGYRFHKGIDITGGGFEGSPIVAARDGVVEVAEYSSTYGNFVIVDHGYIDGNLYKTVYAHCSSLSVNVGQKVTQGQILGAGGDTGFSFGAHLHYEVRIAGKQVNPKPYLPADLPINLV